MYLYPLKQLKQGRNLFTEIISPESILRTVFYSPWFAMRVPEVGSDNHPTWVPSTQQKLYQMFIYIFFPFNSYHKINTMDNIICRMFTADDKIYIIYDEVDDVNSQHLTNLWRDKYFMTDSYTHSHTNICNCM